jgi:hypothetical protein
VQTALVLVEASYEGDGRKEFGMTDARRLKRTCGTLRLGCEKKK